MNTFLTVDPSWSYRFFESNKPAISRIDNFFEFADDFYRSAMLYLTTQINFNYGVGVVQYNQHISKAMEICSRYPELGAPIQNTITRLYTDYRPMYYILAGPVVRTEAILDDASILIGIVAVS